MDREDSTLAFEKHATSKISAADDLARISTLGFRGEALSSIASVARSVDLVTKVRSGGVGVAGTHVRIEDGKIVEVGEVGAPAGTTIEVADLFKNVPARRKYLKSGRAELARIAEIVTTYAVIHHHISFGSSPARKRSSNRSGPRAGTTPSSESWEATSPETSYPSRQTRSSYPSPGQWEGRPSPGPAPTGS